MNKTKIAFGACIIVAFASGYAFKSTVQTKEKTQNKAMKKVTGIGGIFFKTEDPKAMREWYAANLGLNTNEYGAVFEWFQGAEPTKKGFSQWSPFPDKTTYFEPSKKEFMINYRVADIESLVAELKQNGVTVVDEIESYDYGKFVHIMDPEGNKIELWEPNDLAFEQLGKSIGATTTK